jgi:Zn-dependent peptidase ImmA (M78 family)/transcriptional regulator with XRE-family HTH domain
MHCNTDGCGTLCVCQDCARGLYSWTVRPTDDRGLALNGLGARLRLAREQVGLSQQEAADELGIAREIISYWEHERRVPSQAQLDCLATAYGTTVRYITGRETSTSGADEHALLYRRIDAQARHTREAAKHWLSFLNSWAVLQVARGERLPGRGRPPKELVQATQSVTDSRRASALADCVRKHYDVGFDAIPDLFAFLDGQGTLVFRAPLGRLSKPGDVSGIYYNHPQLGHCILINSDMTHGRQVFTLAHECAHALFHYRETGMVSRAGDTDRKERFADAFAGHLLVPAATVRAIVARDHVRDAFEVIRLQRYFRVSYATMLYRLKVEGLLTDQQYEEYQGYSPSYLATRLGFDVSDYQQPRQSRGVTLGMYPSSVLWRVLALLRDNELSPIDASSLLQVSLDTVLRDLLARPEEASAEERQEFAELPVTPSR